MARPRAWSDFYLAALKPRDTRYDLTEPGRKGFMLRVWPGGEKVFVTRYQRDGNVRVMTLGPYPAISLADAHEQHEQARRDLLTGVDPIDARRARADEVLRIKAAAGGSRTVDQLIAEFVEHGLTRRDGSKYEEPEQVQRLLKAEVLGQRYDRATKVYKATGDGWSGRTLDTITGREAVELCQAIERRGSAATARVVRRYLKRMFAYAVSSYLLPASPVTELKGGKSGKRSRWLKAEEIRAVWQVLDGPDAPLAIETRLAFKLLLVTGQRAGEVCGAEWRHVDLKRKVWTLPRELTKSRREHTLPLPPLAVEILNSLRALHPASPFVIPSGKRNGEPDLTRPRDPHSLAHAVRDHADRWGIDPWVPHDLRRSMRTHLSRLKVERNVGERILNHAPDELDQVYDHHDFQTEMRAALLKWDRELRKITGPGKAAKRREAA